MSLAERLGTLMQRPNEDPAPRDDVPWWMKYAGRGLGTAGGGLAIFLGMWNVIGILFSINCGLMGIWQMVAGFLVLVVEAPCCCMFVEVAQTWSEWADKRPYWNRAVAYFALATPPILLCFGLASLLGSGSIFGTGVIYGMMALGRKGSQQDMAAMAASPTAMAPGDQGSTLMEDPDVWRPSASSDEMKQNASIVDNAQPMAKTLPPKVAPV